MGIEQILGKIDDDAAGEARGIVAAAAEEAGRIRGEWQERAADESSRRRLLIDDEAQRIHRQAAAEARLEGTKAVLSRRREWLGRVVEKALERLLDDASADAPVILATMAAAHLDGEVTAVVFSGDKAGTALAGGLRQKLTQAGAAVSVAESGLAPRGGMIVRRGQVMLNLSFDRLLADLAERRQFLLQRVLFGEGDGRDA